LRHERPAGHEHRLHATLAIWKNLEDRRWPVVHLENMKPFPYQVYVREISSQGVRLPEELGEPKGHWRLMENGGFIAADLPPRRIRDSIDVYRWIAFSKPVEIVNGHIVVPRLYQNLGLLPRFGEHVVLFGRENWCEMWSKEAWLAHIRGIAKDLPNLVAAVQDELDARK
jgi:hypothetical protein